MDSHAGRGGLCSFWAEGSARWRRGVVCLTMVGVQVSSTSVAGTEVDGELEDAGRG